MMTDLAKRARTLSVSWERDTPPDSPLCALAQLLRALADENDELQRQNQEQHAAWIDADLEGQLDEAQRERDTLKLAASCERHLLTIAVAALEWYEEPRQHEGDRARGALAEIRGTTPERKDGA
jgi:hypothetical protein